jgi:hypothetical protein
VPAPCSLRPPEPSLGLLKRQPNGEEGVLLIDGKDNVFYAIGKDHQLWAVSANWHPDVWYVEAELGKYPRW